MNRRAIAIMFIRLSVHLSVDYIIHFMHFSVNLSLRLEMFCAPWHQNMSTCSLLSFSNSRWGMDLQTGHDISRMVEDRG